ncbi:TPA: response regulator transcription factor [Morganella morganii]
MDLSSFSFIYNDQYLNWAFSGIGLTVMAGLLRWVYKKFFHNSDDNMGAGNNMPDNKQIITINNNMGQHGSDSTNGEKMELKEEKDTIEQAQKRTHILFIDDKKFLVTDILVSSGWSNTRAIKDVTSMNQKEIRDSDIIFVDIQGVGIKMKFAEEGLGLAKVLKERYPDKKIIVYSAEQTGNRFHETLKLVDDFLPKDADPYLFEEIIERFSLKNQWA